MLTHRAEARPTGWSRGCFVLAECYTWFMVLWQALTAILPGGAKVARRQSMTRASATGANRKRKMSLPRWALAVAGEAGGPGGGNAALAAVTSLPNLDDRALVVEAQVGNRAAFEELVRRYDRDVLRLALEPDEAPGRCPGRLPGSFPQGLPQPAPIPL